MSITQMEEGANGLKGATGNSLGDCILRNIFGICFLKVFKKVF
jgi:hypothetical protein